MPLCTALWTLAFLTWRGVACISIELQDHCACHCHGLDAWPRKTPSSLVHFKLRRCWLCYLSQVVLSCTALNCLATLNSPKHAQVLLLVSIMAGMHSIQPPCSIEREAARHIHVSLSDGSDIQSSDLPFSQALH